MCTAMDLFEPGVEEAIINWSKNEWPENRGNYGCRGPAINDPSITVGVGLDPNNPLGIDITMTSPIPEPSIKDLKDLEILINQDPGPINRVEIGGITMPPNPEIICGGWGLPVDNPSPPENPVDTISIGEMELPQHCGGEADPSFVEVETTDPSYVELPEGGIETTVNLGGSYCEACNHMGPESLEVMANNNQAPQIEAPQQNISNPSMV